jgi:hypothetical protein
MLTERVFEKGGPLDSLAHLKSIQLLTVTPTLCCLLSVLCPLLSTLYPLLCSTLCSLLTAL